MSNNPHNLKVGQKIFAVQTVNVRNSRPETKWFTIEKIGRKWATVLRHGCDMRIDMQTLRADGKGYTSPFQFYLDDVAYKAETERRKLYKEVAVNFSHYGAGDISLDKLKKIKGIIDNDR